jgi:hypothetical protein
MVRRSKRGKMGLNEPLRHPDHKRPVTRRDFLAQGFLTGAATVVAPTLMGLFANPGKSFALSPDLEALKAPSQCDIQAGAGKVPFICFDLAGGANIAGSNVLVGKEGGQRDFLTTAGYSKLGLPGDMTPASATTNFIEDRLGLLFHTDSAFLRGMLTTMQVATMANVDGVIIPSRSENDTSNNPHNPMYGIARTGARGELLTLIGSQSSDSGGNSMAPAMMIDPTVRPTKVDRTTDATGLIDTGELGTLLPQNDTVAVMESIARVSWSKLGRVTTGLTTDADAKKLVRCGYVKTAYLAEAFGDPSETNPAQDPFIQAIFAGVGGINADREYEKTAAVMKLVTNGYAGAGTISMGGFDYHTGERATGEMRDFRAGQCMGACLEYAARIQQPLMLYVFSDGSLSSNGMIDSSTGGRGKGVWTGDNQQTAAAFFLVYNPTGRPNLLIPGRQIGYFRPSGDVETGGSIAANNVNLLVETVILNYMALHGEQGQFRTLFPNSSISNALIDSLVAFAPI